MDTKLSLTKELHDLRQEAADLENKVGEEFKELMIKINAVKAKLAAFGNDKDGA